MITTQQIKQYLKREYLLSLFFQIGPVFLLTAIFGTALVVALEKGTKWLFLCVVAYMAIAVGVFFKDKFHYLLIILSSCAGIGIQYKLLSHGTKNELVNHYGGAMAEPVLNLIDFPIFLLVFYALFDILANKRALPKWSNIDYWILAFILSSMISLINTHEYGLYFWEMFRYLKYYLLYWVLRTYLTKPLYYWTIYIISVSLLFIHGFVSALQYFLYFSLPVPVGGVSGSHFELVNNQVIQRVTGVLGHSNTFSAYLSIILGVALVLLFVRYSYIFKPLPIPFILFGILALILTFSRNGWMIFAFECMMILAMVLYNKRLNPAFLFALILVSALAFGFLVVSGVFEMILMRVFDDDGKAFDSRWDLLNVGWQMVKDSPLFGIGLNSFEENMVQYDLTKITNVIQQPVHNSYMLIAAETGIITLSIVLVIWLKLIKKSWILFKENTELSFAVGAIGLNLLLGQGLSNHFDVTLRKEPIMAQVVILCGALIAYWEHKRNKTFENEQ